MKNGLLTFHEWQIGNTMRDIIEDISNLIGNIDSLDKDSVKDSLLLFRTKLISGPLNTLKVV